MAEGKKAIKMRKNENPSLYVSKLTYWMITLVHDNPLLPIFKNPYKILESAGLKKGQEVLEIGCGPGFFTIPASEIVGESGKVYAIDLNPFMIERVKKKIEEKDIKNVVAIIGNASKTNLPDESVNLAFIFGIRHVFGGIENVIAETRRVLKNNGTLSIETVRPAKSKLIEIIQKNGFTYLEEKDRLLIFKAK